MLGKDQGEALVIVRADAVAGLVGPLVVLQVIECGYRKGDLAEDCRLISFMMHGCFLQDGGESARTRASAAGSYGQQGMKTHMEQEAR